MIVKRGRDTGFSRSSEIVIVLSVEDAEFLIEDMYHERDGFWRDMVKGLQEQVDAIRGE